MENNKHNATRNLINQALVRRWFNQNLARLRRPQQAVAFNMQATRGPDFLWREISLRMHERLDYIRLNPHWIVDAGCGLGMDLSSLQQRYSSAQIIGVDFATKLLQVLTAAAARPWWHRMLHRLGISQPTAQQLLGANYAALPLAANSLDLIWSNAALQWHDNPLQVFTEWQRVLKVDGLLMFSTFGPDTLVELRQALAEVDCQQEWIMPFVDMHDLGDMLVQCGFATPVIDMEKLTLTYATAADLLADVRLFGPNPLRTNRPESFGKQRYARLVEALTAQRHIDGRLHLTLEIVYGHAWKAARNTLSDGRTLVQFHPPRVSS